MHAKHPEATIDPEVTIDIAESGLIRCSLENKRNCLPLLRAAILN